MKALGSLPTFKGFKLSGRFTSIGGTRYTLTVDADINGDFVGGPGKDNDLAFIFDPNDSKTPAAIKAYMAKALSNPDNRAAYYIYKNLGTIADPNGGENPFSGIFDLRGCLNLVSNLYFETEDDFFSTDKVLATQQ